MRDKPKPDIDAPQPRIDHYGTPWCNPARDCSEVFSGVEGKVCRITHYRANTLELCEPMVRNVVSELNESRAIIRALTRALTLAVGEERAAAELEKAHKEAKDA